MVKQRAGHQDAPSEVSEFHELHIFSFYFYSRFCKRIQQGILIDKISFTDTQLSHIINWCIYIRLLMETAERPACS